MKLQFFTSTQDVLAYMKEELLASLQDDLTRMDTFDAKHYRDVDRDEMRARIADVEALAPFLRIEPPQ